ncbi:MAG: biotin--[acetyl-CoA-carboxylase] ligase [Sphingomonas taxi]
MTIRTVAETGSTNADMLLLAAQGVGEGVWLRAERQTAGRGRLGRVWTAPPGNLSASTLVRLRPGDPPPATLALVAAVALHEAVRLFLAPAVPMQLKWPNDLLVAGAKLSGILLERGGDAVVVGIGVNLAHHPDLPDRPTTSLAAHGVAIDAEAFLDVLAEGFARWLARWRGEGLATLRTAWLAAAHPPGTALSARLPDGTVLEGLFDGLDPDGALILRLASGSRHVIHAADVFLL